jgi:hypothetical protein
MYTVSNPSISTLKDSTFVLNTLLTRRKELDEIASHCTFEIQKINAAIELIYEKPAKRINWTKEVIQFFNLYPEKQKTKVILDWIFRDTKYELSDSTKRRLYITGLSVALMNMVKKGILKSYQVSGENGRYYTKQ